MCICGVLYLPMKIDVPRVSAKKLNPLDDSKQWSLQRIREKLSTDYVDRTTHAVKIQHTAGKGGR